MGPAPPVTYSNKALGPSLPLEPTHLHLFAHDERAEGTYDAILEHDQERSVLFLLRVRIDQRLSNELAQGVRAGLLLPFFMTYSM